MQLRTVCDELLSETLNDFVIRRFEKKNVFSNTGAGCQLKAETHGFRSRSGAFSFQFQFLSTKTTQRQRGIIISWSRDGTYRETVSVAQRRRNLIPHALLGLAA